MIRKASWVVLAWVLTLTQVGCPFLIGAAVVAAVAVGAYTYANGELSRDYGNNQSPVTVERAYEASLKVAEASKITVTEKNCDKWKGFVKGKTVDQEVTITTRWVNETTVNIGVRFGFAGDRPKSEDIHKQLEKELFPQ